MRNDFQFRQEDPRHGAVLRGFMCMTVQQVNPVFFQFTDQLEKDTRVQRLHAITCGQVRNRVSLSFQVILLISIPIEINKTNIKTGPIHETV